MVRDLDVSSQKLPARRVSPPRPGSFHRIDSRLDLVVRVLGGLAGVVLAGVVLGALGALIGAEIVLPILAGEGRP